MFDLFRLSTVVLSVFCLIFVLHSNMHELYFVFINCVLISFLNSAFWLVAQVCTHFPSNCCLCMSRFSYVHDHSGYSLIYSSTATSASFYQQRPDFRDLEGYYGLHRTFPISNLTPEPDPVFRRSPFPKPRVALRVFLSYFVYPFKNKTKISGDFKSFLINKSIFQIKIELVIRVGNS